jgi:signal transduction histidine kinase
MAVVDSNAVYRCLLNLVSNAIDALPDDGGTVGFATRYDRQERVARLAVADSGCGIAPELLPMVFDVFVSTKGSRGTGLGLAVVQKLATAHGGRVEVDSQLGKGTTFTLVLPLHPPQQLHQTSLRTIALPDGVTELKPPRDG